MDIFNQFLTNAYYASLLVFFTQTLMMYFRTINILYTTKKNIIGAVWSNNANAITWLLSTTIGMHSILNGQWQPLLMYLVGGSLGTYWGIKTEEKINKNGIKKTI